MKQNDSIIFDYVINAGEKKIDAYREIKVNNETVREKIGGCKWRREMRLDQIIWLKGIYVQHTPVNYQRRGIGTHMIELIRAIENFDSNKDKILCHIVPTPPMTTSEAYRFYAYNQIYVGNLSGVSTMEDVEKFQIPKFEDE